MESHILTFKSTANSSGRLKTCRCQIEICRTSNLVIATEIGDGVDVAENSETIANEVVRQFGLNAQRLFFIENYGDNTPFENAYLIDFCVEEGIGLRNPRSFVLPPSVLEKIRLGGKGPDFGRLSV